MLKRRLRIDNSSLSEIECDNTKEKPRKHTVAYSYISHRTCMWKVIVTQRFYGCLFCSSKKTFYEKMSDVGRFIIIECVTEKEIHVLHLSECARRYGSDKKTKRLDGLVITDVNIPTATGTASWFVPVRFHLGGGRTKLHELSFSSVNKSAAPVIREEEHEIHDSVPIDRRLIVDTITVQVHEYEFQEPNNGGEAPTPILPNPYQIIQPPVPPNNQEVVEIQPVLPAED